MPLDKDEGTAIKPESKKSLSVSAPAISIDQMPWQDLDDEWFKLQKQLDKIKNSYITQGKLYKFHDAYDAVKKSEKKINDLVASNPGLAERAVQEGRCLELDFKTIKHYGLGQNNSKLKKADTTEFEQAFDNIKKNLSQDPRIPDSQFLQDVTDYVRMENKSSKLRDVIIVIKPKDKDLNKMMEPVRREGLALVKAQKPGILKPKNTPPTLPKKTVSFMEH